MSLEVRLGQRQEQRLALLPQMLQSIEVLQMATTDLLQFLELEAERNETLELLEAPGPDPDLPEPTHSEREDDAETWRPRTAEDGDGKRAFLESVADGAESLVDFVREQLAFRGVPDDLASTVVRLCEHLDDRGLLPFSLGELAAEFDLPLFSASFSSGNKFAVVFQ